MKWLSQLLTIGLLLAACTPSAAQPSLPFETATASPSATASPRPTIKSKNSTATLTPIPPTPLAATPAAYEGTPFARPATVITPQNAHQIVELAQWGRGIIQDIAYSPDGESVVVTTSNGIYIHDRNDFDAPPEVIHVDGFFVFSEDLTLLATTKQVMRISDQKIILMFPEDVYQPLGFSPDGRYVAIHIEKSIRIWDLETSEETVVFNFYPRAIRFSPDSKRVAVGDFLYAFIYDFETGKKTPLNQLRWVDGQPTRPIQSIVFSSDGETLAVGYSPGDYITDVGDAIDVFRVSDGEILYGIPDIGNLPLPHSVTCDESYFGIHPPHPAYAESVTFSPNGRLLAVIYRDWFGSINLRENSQLILYRSSDGAELRKVSLGAKAIAFSPDSGRIMIASNDGIIEEWLIRDFTKSGELHGYNGRVLDLSFSPDNRFIGIEFYDRARIQSLLDGSVIQDYIGAQIAFAPDGQTYALGYNAGHIQIRNMANGNLLKTIYAHPDNILDIVFLPSGDLVSSAENCAVYLWDLETGNRILTFEDYIAESYLLGRMGRFRMYSLTSSADGNILVGDIDDGFAVWETSSGELINSSHVTGIPMSEWIFSYSSLSSALNVFQFSDLEEDTQSWEDMSYVRNSAFSPTGELLITADRSYNDSNITIHMADDTSKLLSFLTLQTEITSLIFSRDGTFFISVALDGTIRFWGIAP